VKTDFEDVKGTGCTYVWTKDRVCVQSRAELRAMVRTFRLDFEALQALELRVVKTSQENITALIASELFRCGDWQLFELQSVVKQGL
jgi:hypothetical protein